LYVGKYFVSKMRPPRPLGTPPEEGNTNDFPSSGGVPERRGGFSQYCKSSQKQNHKT